MSWFSSSLNLRKVVEVNEPKLDEREISAHTFFLAFSQTFISMHDLRLNEGLMDWNVCVCVEMYFIMFSLTQSLSFYLILVKENRYCFITVLVNVFFSHQVVI